MTLLDMGARMRVKIRRVSMVAVAMVMSTALTAGTAAAGPAGVAGDGRGPTASIRVTDKPLASPIQQEFVGVNHRWPDGGLGMWNAEQGRADPTIVKYSRRAELELVRYPGGTVANLFDWKKAIGPQDERGCQVGGGFVGGAGPKDSVYGPDEHMQYVEAIGAQASIMSPAAGQSARDAADWVEYMNAPVGANPNGGKAWARVRADNGHPEPYDIEVWEVGNETYLKGQRYWRSEDYDTRLRQYAFGGTQRHTGEPVGTECDHRPEAGTSDGGEGQTFQVHYPPVVPDSQTVYVGGTTWRPVSDLSAAGPNAAVYEFDPETGRVTFGDGEHGAIPPKGAQVTADYDSGPHPGFVDFYQEMKAVDPSIDVCSAWARPEFVELMGTERPYDCLGVHLYGHPALDAPPKQLYDRLMQLVPKVLGEVEALEKAIAEHAPSNDPPYIGASEFGQISKPDTRPGPQGWNGSLMSGLYYAELLAGMVEHGVAFAESSNLNRAKPTIGELFGGAPNFLYTARASVHELFGQLAGSRPVVSDVRNNPEATGGAGYDALHVVSTRAGDGTVRLLVINRDKERAISARVHADGVRGRDVPMRVSTLNAESFMSYNNAEHPNDVAIETSQRTVPGAGFAYRFPAHSVTVLEVTP